MWINTDNTVPIKCRKIELILNIISGQVSHVVSVTNHVISYDHSIRYAVLYCKSKPHLGPQFEGFLRIDLRLIVITEEHIVIWHLLYLSGMTPVN